MSEYILPEDGAVDYYKNNPIDDLSDMYDIANGLNDDLPARLYNMNYNDTIGVYKNDKDYVLMIYQDGYYNEDSTKTIDERLTKISDHLHSVGYAAYDMVKDSDEKEDQKITGQAKALMVYASSIHNDIKRKNIKARISTLNYTPIKKLNTNKRIISLPKGSLIIDLGQKTIEYDGAHHPEALNTYRMDAEYDPYATCPRIKEYIREALSYNNTGERRPAEDREKILEEARAFRACFGYSMFCGNPQQIIVLIRGSTRSGKGVISTLLKWCYGTYAKGGRRDLVVVQENDRIRSDAGISADKHLVIVDELRKTDVIDTGQLRYYTNENIIVEVKYQNPYERPNNMTPWIITNFENPFDSTDDAILSRIILFEMYRPPPEVEDPLFAKELYDQERDGLLQYAIEGLRDYMANGKKALYPEHMKNKMIDELAGQDRLRPYLDQCLIRTNKNGKSELLIDVFGDMITFYENRNEPAPCRDTRMLARMLRERKYDVHTSDGKSKVFNIERISPFGGSISLTASDIRQNIFDYLQKNKDGTLGKIQGYMLREKPNRIKDILDVMARSGEIMEKTPGYYILSYN